jgi:hypothetical protein
MTSNLKEGSVREMFTDKKSKGGIDPSAHYEDDQVSVMSKVERGDAVRSFFDNKRTMSVPTNKW